MDWVRRLFRGSPAVPPAAPRDRGAAEQQHWQVMTFDGQRPDAIRDIVGEAYRQENVQFLLEHALPGQWVGAILEPESTNPKDRNAVRVIAMTADGQRGALVGYLTRDDAIAYKPVFARIAPLALHTQATVIPGHDRARDGSRIPGVRIRLGSPGELLAELWSEGLSPNATHPWIGQLVCFSGQSSRAIFGTPLDRDGQAWLARRAGCEVWPRMTKKVSLCVVSSVDVDTEKVRKAEEQGTAVVTESEFWSTVGFPLEAW